MELHRRLWKPDVPLALKPLQILTYTRLESRYCHCLWKSHHQTPGPLITEIQLSILHFNFILIVCATLPDYPYPNILPLLSQDTDVTICIFNVKKLFLESVLSTWFITVIHFVLNQWYVTTRGSLLQLSSQTSKFLLHTVHVFPPLLYQHSPQMPVRWWDM